MDASAAAGSDPATLGERARYTDIKFIEDPAFDANSDQFDWLAAVCDKHRERFHEEIDRLAGE